jgi:hypothetical protein
MQRLNGYVFKNAHMQAAFFADGDVIASVREFPNFSMKVDDRRTGESGRIRFRVSNNVHPSKGQSSAILKCSMRELLNDLERMGIVTEDADNHGGVSVGFHRLVTSLGEALREQGQRNTMVTAYSRRSARTLVVALGSRSSFRAFRRWKDSDNIENYTKPSNVKGILNLDGELSYFMMDSMHCVPSKVMASTAYVEAEIEKMIRDHFPCFSTVKITFFEDLGYRIGAEETGRRLEQMRADQDPTERESAWASWVPMEA